MSERLSMLACAGSIALAFCVSPPELAAQAGKVIVLQHADSLVGRVIDGEDVRELIGNVVILQENVRVTCDRALQWIATGRVDLTGHVVVEDDSVTFRAPRGVYLRDERVADGFEGVQLTDGTSTVTARQGRYAVGPRVAVFAGDVVVVDSLTTVRADSVTYFRTERRSIATGQVRVHSVADNIVVTGGWLDHDAARNYSRMVEDPLLMQADTAGGAADTLLVRGAVLEAYRDSTQRMIVTDSVRILRGEMAGTCGQAVFYTAADSITLRQSPVLWYEETQITGDSIDVFLRLRALDRIAVTGSAFAISRSDSAFPGRYDQLTGEAMAMMFAAKRLRTIRVDRRAISVYHLYEDSLANGLNRMTGDRVIMSFDEGALSGIGVYGGVEGAYYPERMVAGRVEEYRITGFNLNAHRPTRAQMQRAPAPAVRPARRTRTDRP